MSRIPPNLRRLLVLTGLTIAGWAAAEILGLRDLSGDGLYTYGTAALLAIGLYGATSGISVAEARRDIRTIVLVVTVGVVLKAVIVAALLMAVFRDPLFIVLAITTAQIDPLSVAALLDDSRLSARARTVLVSWSAFDDPVTVVLTFFVATTLAPALDQDGRMVNAIGGLPGTGTGSLIATLLLNLALLVFAAVLWRVSRRFGPAVRAVPVFVVAALAVWRMLMLGLATAGLFMRPSWKKWGLWTGRAVTAAFYAAVVLLGALLADGIRPGAGLALGAAAFGAQVVVGFALTGRMSRADRVHLAFSQQNGITSIILALTLESVVHGAAAVIAPAVITINVLHLAFGALLDRRPGLFGLPSAPMRTPAATPPGSAPAPRSRPAGPSRPVMPPPSRAVSNPL